MPQNQPPVRRRAGRLHAAATRHGHGWALKRELTGVAIDLLPRDRHRQSGG